MCEPNYINCLQNHLYRTVDAHFVVDQRRLDGHVYFSCRKCTPPTFFFGVVASRPSPIVHCYAISKEQFRYWHDSQADPLSTTEMLNRLGYNDRWRQPRV